MGSLCRCCAGRREVCGTPRSLAGGRLVVTVCRGAPHVGQQLCALGQRLRPLSPDLLLRPGRGRPPVSSAGSPPVLF